MADQISFKTRVRNTIVQYAPQYYSFYVCHDYLLLSESFSDSPYYVISAEKDNYLHLTGVSTTLSPSDFFSKCLNGSLSEDDFDLAPNEQMVKNAKGTIRRKIKALPFIFDLMDTSCYVEEHFCKNAIYCSFASSDGACTMGFVTTPTARPKTLLIGNELDVNSSSHIKAILSKSRDEDKYTTITSGSYEDFKASFQVIQDLLSDNLALEFRKAFMK